MNSVLLDIIVKGRGFHIPRYPQLILGDGKKYLQGDILDANAVVTEIDGQVAKIIDAAPEALDTLKEIADSLHGDADIAGTLISKITNVENTVAELADSQATTISELTSDITEDIAELQTGKVDVVSGKQLSTEDYTTAEKTKLAGIEAGAQVNPTNVSAFTNDAGYLTEHQSLADYATQAWVNGKGFLTEHQDISNKANIADIPTKTSDLTNDSGFLTQHQDISGKANIVDLATVATSGSYNDLADTPDLNLMLSAKQDVLTAGAGIKIQNGVISNTVMPASEGNEIVQVVVTSIGATVSNLALNVYYNNESEPHHSYTTDENGMCSFNVPYGYVYEIVFPTIAGYKEITPEKHTATLIERGIEVEYEALPQEGDDDYGEKVTVHMSKKSGNTLTNFAEASLTVTVDGTSTTYTTDSTGSAAFVVPYGKSYTVSAANVQDYYISRNAYSNTYEAAKTRRIITYTYRKLQSGLFIVCSNGDEYTLDQWEAALANETVTYTDAVIIKVATTSLANNGGVFGVFIDHIRERSYGADGTWAAQNVQFNSIPLNGNSSSALYYYDGLTASKLVQAEGDERDIATPAVDKCLSFSYTIGEEELPGFLGSTGQWANLWANVVEFDDMLVATRPEGTYLLSTLTTNKWTITQGGATGAFYWSTYANNGFKYNGYVVIPFLAF